MKFTNMSGIGGAALGVTRVFALKGQTESII